MSNSQQCMQLSHEVPEGHPFVKRPIPVNIKHRERSLYLFTRGGILPPWKALVDDIVHVQNGYLDLQRIQATVVVVINLVEHLVDDSVEHPIEKPAVYVCLSYSTTC